MSFSSQNENALLDVISLYVFGGTVIMPNTMCQQKSESKSKVKNWRIDDHDALKFELTECLADLIPSLAPAGQKSISPTSAINRSFAINQIFDSAIVTIEIWKNNFVIRAWANNGDGSSDCFPIFQTDLPESGGLGPLIESMLDLMMQLSTNAKLSETASQNDAKE